MVPPRRNDGKGLPRSLYADGWLMDRQIVDVDALPVDKVDDLEEEAVAGEAVHRATCPKRGRTLRYVT
jgi:hypothetical protein